LKEELRQNAYVEELRKQKSVAGRQMNAARENFKHHVAEEN